MKEYILKAMIDLFKWCLVILFLAVAFYIVYPKHEYRGQGGTRFLTFNKFTGEAFIREAQKQYSFKASGYEIPEGFELEDPEDLPEGGE